jgi:hypothetical protein
MTAGDWLVVLFVVVAVLGLAMAVWAFWDVFGRK